MITKIHLLRMIYPAGVEVMCLNLTKLDNVNRNIAIYTKKSEKGRGMLEKYKEFFDSVIYIDPISLKYELKKIIDLEKKINKKIILISWFFPLNLKFLYYLDIPTLNHIGNPSHAHSIIRKIKNQLIFLNLYLFKMNKIGFAYASNFIKKSYRKNYFFPKSVYEKVIYNGDYTVRKQINILNLSKIRFAMVGRLNKIKNFSEFIYFCHKFNLTNKGHEYLIIGDGEEFESLNALNYKLGSICKFLGIINNKEKIYENFDILLFFNTNAEGFGNVIIESMNRCKLVVVKDCGGPAELIQDGVTGLKFKNIVDLNLKLKKIMKNSSKLKKIIQNAKQKFDKTFEINKTKDKYDLMIKRLTT